MNRCMVSVSGIVVFVLGTSLVAAQPAGPRGGHMGPRPHGPDPLMRALDTDRNGELSAEEIAQAPAGLKELDANGDGKITQDELMPPPPPDTAQNGEAGDLPPPPPPSGPNPVLRALDANGDGALTHDELRPPPPLGPLMQALDTDKNGELSAEEIANAPKALLTLDKNADGKLTLDELMPPPPPRPGQHAPASQRAQAASKVYRK